MFLVCSLCLGWPLINKLAPHAHQLLPLRDGNNDVLLCGYQRQTQQTASEQSWILSWEGEQWVGSDPALHQKVPISPCSIYSPPEKLFPVFLSAVISPQPQLWCCIFNHIPRPQLGKKCSQIPTGKRLTLRAASPPIPRAWEKSSPRTLIRVSRHVTLYRSTVALQGQLRLAGGSDFYPFPPRGLFF